MTQPEMTQSYTTIGLDEDGFLLDPENWSQDLAATLAAHDGLVLSEEHWELLKSLRDFYFTHGYAPQERHVCFLHQQDKYCLDRLFHDQYREAWRLAGLPNPGEEYKSYM